jgi:hypothetical protein
MVGWGGRWCILSNVLITSDRSRKERKGEYLPTVWNGACMGLSILILGPLLESRI